ncbi:hypothetical protein GCM10007884_41410 [Methylobacterium brachythecii]|uniref:Uncharacterized protein n=1 Tax=Methylobacterium brachythecii TaxID=1176177 RepID=A0ABQ6DC97_9HYPH|nr:hypothetical protein GCM10007884_41410 [Methylobacterium brachythecii]
MRLSRRRLAPETDGKLERFVQTGLREWAYDTADQRHPIARTKAPNAHPIRFRTHPATNCYQPPSRLALIDLLPSTRR